MKFENLLVILSIIVMLVIGIYFAQISMDRKDFCEANGYEEVSDIKRFSGTDWIRCCKTIIGYDEHGNQDFEQLCEIFEVDKIFEVD